MHGFSSISTAWKVLVGVVIPLKIAFFGVGYVSWMLAAPSGVKRRSAILDHVRSVLSTVQEMGQSPDHETLSQLHRAIAQLDTRVSAGWKHHEDLTALIRLLKYVSGIHLYETKDAIYDLKSSTWKLIIDVIEPMLSPTPRTQ